MHTCRHNGEIHNRGLERTNRFGLAMTIAATINQIAAAKALATLRELQAQGYESARTDRSDVVTQYLTAMERAALVATTAILYGLTE
jgi:hypothetical protein